ncbi:hypothetical protein CCYN49044_640009 [Capnocytophaga cynodegmi]|uniref:Uncharacterized protein n=1 Tax=Capnocytophaga cynodegmi TaxID=28189 RepID=A0A0B7HMK6_9FLAO|nr:hypothetical protein CCYN74_320013 [Capnocytophaga cynodegmi]CEN42147.1 hypothetical protein CCYN49044_640009 [Capnocytophaga cynodegmi]
MSKNQKTTYKNIKTYTNNIFSIKKYIKTTINNKQTTHKNIKSIKSNTNN